MRDRGMIYVGLAVFLGLATFPAWRDLAARVNAKGPNPALPKIERQCVAPVAYMRTSHMNLLLAWREDVVRRGGLDYAAFDGRHYDMNLTATCLKQCHGTKADFCDRCHTYAAVSPPCWDCHLDSRSSRFLALNAYRQSGGGR
jgi:hypothetical protein